MIELISTQKFKKLSVNAKVNLDIDDGFEREHKRTERIPKGAIGEIIAETGPVYTIRWENGIVSKIHAELDMIREVKMPVRVYLPNSKFHLHPWEIADWANEVHNLLYSDRPFSKDICMDRLRNHHCLCGTNADGYSNGVFEMLPMNHKSVRDMGIAYMICRKCGAISHL